MPLHESPVTKPAAMYAPRSGAEGLFAYPFERPQGSFMTDGATVTMLPTEHDDFRSAANDMLAHAGVPPLEGRIPLIMYGSNANPIHLDAKMRKFPVAADLTASMSIVPAIQAEIPGTQVVWHGKPAQKGSVFAELYEDPQTRDQAALLHVAFFTPEQLAAMHTTEGGTYHLQQLEALVGAQALQAVVYVAGKSAILLKDGEPVPVKRPSEPALPGAMSAHEAVAYMLDGTASIQTPQDLVAEMAGLSLAERKVIQERIYGRLVEAGRSGSFSFSAPEAGRIGRADVGSLPLYGKAACTGSVTGPQPITLTEARVAPLRPTLPPDRPAADPMTQIRKWASKELQDRGEASKSVEIAVK